MIPQQEQPPMRQYPGLANIALLPVRTLLLSVPTDIVQCFNTMVALTYPRQALA
jgi:hypothetical protein